MAKHSWTKEELTILCICYLEKASIETALLLTGTWDAKSIDMRYRNCLFLEQGRVEGSLSHPSKLHVQVWCDLCTVYSTIKKIKEYENEKNVVEKAEEQEEVKDVEPSEEKEEKKVEKPDETFDRIVDISIAMAATMCFMVAIFALFMP